MVQRTEKARVGRKDVGRGAYKNNCSRDVSSGDCRQGGKVGLRKRMAQ